jgi:hypothetical protein
MCWDCKCRCGAIKYDGPCWIFQMLLCIYCVRNICYCYNKSELDKFADDCDNHDYNCDEFDLPPNIQPPNCDIIIEPQK